MNRRRLRWGPAQAGNPLPPGKTGLPSPSPTLPPPPAAALEGGVLRPAGLLLLSPSEGEVGVMAPLPHSSWLSSEPKGQRKAGSGKTKLASKVVNFGFSNFLSGSCPPHF